jgi:hypothetical protein
MPGQVQSAVRIATAVTLSAFLLAPAGARGTSAQAGPNPIAVENARQGTTEWKALYVTDAIEAYASETSVLPSETVHFHVSTSPAELYHIHVYRLGWYGGLGAREVACIPADCGQVSSGEAFVRPSPEPGTGKVDARWPVTDELRIPEDWVSGYYLARVELRSGDNDGKGVPVLFVVREPSTRQSPILVHVPVNTWQAYNPWGGKSLYDEISVDGRANRVSFDRPLPTNFTMPLEWEIQLVRFLEREGYDVSYQTDVDTHRDPGSLLRHRLVIVNGHDEYWTSAIRDAFDVALAESTNLAFLGANIGYWQVRYEDAERTVVGYKSFADPVTDPRLQTVLFRQLAPPRPECELLGVQWEEGKKTSGDPPRDFTVTSAAVSDPWLAGTGLAPGTRLSELVGPEWDTISPTQPASCRKPGSIVLFHYEGSPANGDALRYVAPSGARVFSASSLQFSWALDDWLPPSRPAPYPAIPGVQQFMRNALADLARPAPPTSLRAEPLPGGIRLHVSRARDPRVSSTTVSGPGGTVCRSPLQAFRCVQRGLPGHRRYSYTALTRDPWGESSARTTTVLARNNTPVVRLAGPGRVPAGSRARYVVTASDLDGDKLRFEWRADGRRQDATGRRLVARFAMPGRHVVVVRVRDGHGGRGTARRVVVVQR